LPPACHFAANRLPFGFYFWNKKLFFTKKKPAVNSRLFKVWAAAQLSLGPSGFRGLLQ
jgi:hypothetical protein